MNSVAQDIIYNVSAGIVQLSQFYYRAQLKN